MQSKDSIANLFGGKNAQAMGINDESSSIIIQNLGGSVMPMCSGSPFTDDEASTDDWRLIMLILDASGSMEEVENELRNSVNEIVIPGLLGGASDVVGAIRMAGIQFNSQVSPLWGATNLRTGGWKPLTEIPKLTATDYRASGSTALNKAVMDGVTALTAYALQISQTTGTFPECVLAVLSDGANNQSPMDPEPIRIIISGLNAELYTTVFIGFETYERVNFVDIGKGLGFREVISYKAKPGEGVDDQRRRFRHMMNVFSSSLIKRTSSSQVGTGINQAQAAQSGTGFFVDDDDQTT